MRASRHLMRRVAQLSSMAANLFEHEDKEPVEDRPADGPQRLLKLRF